MVKIDTGQTPSSPSTSMIAAAGMIAAAQIMFTEIPRPAIRVARFEYAGSSSTSGQTVNPFATMIAIPRAEPSLIAFYHDLISQQEELGEDFSKVLFDNIWELYAR